MIKKVRLHNTACYNDPVEFSPKEINYFFGSNGVGKSSLGKVLSNVGDYPECDLTWVNDQIEVSIYNKNFVNASFSQSNQIKGIFTLGKDSTETQNFISQASIKLEALETRLRGLENSKSEKSTSLNEAREKLQRKSWALKRKHEDHFKPAFVSHMGSAESFLNKCLTEQSNSADLLSEQDLISKCERVFNDNLQAVEPINEFTFTELNDKERSEILSTKIIGKEDVDISRLVQKLDNSDWVKEGVEYLSITENTCPFCQQGVSPDLKTEIESFFDESYDQQKKMLTDFIADYKAYVEDLIGQVESLLARELEILDYSVLKDKLDLLKGQYKNNLGTLETKKRSLSLVVTINSLEDVLSEISTVISNHKSQVEENNRTVSNIKSAKSTLKSEVWRFIVEELKDDVKEYSSLKGQIDQALNGISSAIKTTQREKTQLEKEVAEKESEITSVKPTVNEINKILSLFGFTNFSLSEAEKKGFYKVIREDGSEVHETLSEGESTFLTFLYFYHLQRGSTSDTGIGKDKVIIIDDPISSLDSNVIFIVSNLTKELIRDVRNKRNGLKQIFVLSHNVYFFKEVTFKGNGNNKWKEEAFWIIRKLDNSSRIQEHNQNPIKTTYELLWRELDDVSNINTATIFNTLRRILEYYFNILGGLDYEDAISKFEGEEQIICRSLISWINDGSHFINDDLVVDAEPENVSKYLEVFKLIFERLGHQSHYHMMMAK